MLLPDQVLIQQWWRSCRGHWPPPPTLGRLTWSVERENVAFTLGGALGRVGLRAAAGAPAALPLRRNLLVGRRVQIWEQKKNLQSVTERPWTGLRTGLRSGLRSSWDHGDPKPIRSQQSGHHTCGVLPLAPIAPQDGAGGRGQTLQRGGRQNLFGAELRQLRKALLEIHLREDPARPTGTHQQGIYTLSTRALPWTHAQGSNSLVHRVKGLLQWRRAGLELLGCRSFFLSVWRWQAGLCGGRWREERG